MFTKEEKNRTRLCIILKTWLSKFNQVFTLCKKYNIFYKSLFWWFMNQSQCVTNQTLHKSRLTEQVFSLWNWLWTRQNRFKIWVDQCSYKAQKHLLLLKSKNFHLTDGKILVPLQKGGSILPSRTLVRAIQADRAVVGIWRVDNTKVVATSKRRPISIVAVDCIPLVSSYQW